MCQLPLSGLNQSVNTKVIEISTWTSFQKSQKGIRSLMSMKIKSRKALWIKSLTYALNPKLIHNKLTMSFGPWSELRNSEPSLDCRSGFKPLTKKILRNPIHHSTSTSGQYQKRLWLSSSARKKFRNLYCRSGLKPLSKQKLTNPIQHSTSTNEKCQKTP